MTELTRTKKALRQAIIAVKQGYPDPDGTMVKELRRRVHELESQINESQRPREVT